MRCALIMESRFVKQNRESLEIWRVGKGRVLFARASALISFVTMAMIGA